MKHTFFDVTSREHRLLSQHAGIPILEILGERPKTLEELRDQIKSAADTTRTAFEWADTLSKFDKDTMDVFMGNLSQLETRKQQLSSLFDRLDLQSIINTVSGAPDTAEVAAPTPAPAPTSAPAPVLAPASAPTSAPTPDPSAVESSFLKKTGKDFMEGGYFKKASYVLAAAATFTGARWLWRKAFGDEEHEGGIKKAAKWTVSLLAALAGAVGITKFLEWWHDDKEKKDPPPGGGSILDIPVDVADAGKDFVKGATNAADTLILQPIAGAVELGAAIANGDLSAVIDVVTQRAWSIMFDQEGNIVIQDTLLMPITAPFKATWKSGEFVWNKMSGNGKSTEDFCLVWGEAGVSYLVAKKAAQFWSSGKCPIPLSMKAVAADAIRSLTGPGQAVVDGLRTSLFLTFEKGAYDALKLRYGSQSIVGRFLQKRLSNNTFYLRIKSEDKAKHLLSVFESLTEDAKKMSKFSEGKGYALFSDKEIKAVDDFAINIVESIKDYLKTAKDLKSPVLLRLQEKIAFMNWNKDKILGEVAEVINEFKGDLKATASPATSIDDINKLLDEAFDAGKAADAADTLPFPKDATKPPPTPDDGSGLKKAVGDGVVEPAPAAKAAEAVDAAADAKFKVVCPDGTVVDAVTGKAVGEVAAEAVDATIDSAQAAKQIEILVKQKVIAEALSSLGEGDDVAREAFLRLCKDLTPDDLIRINRSASAQKLFAGAIVAKDPAEVARLMKATSKAGRFMRGLSATAGATGIAGDLFGMYIAYMDFQEYGHKIEATKNPALADFYGHCQLMCTAEGAASAVGLTYQGVAVVGSLKAGGGIVTALGAPAGLVAVPVAIAAVGVAVTRKGLQSSVEYHSAMEQDLLSYPPGKLIEHIAKSSSVSNLNWTQDLFLSNSVLANRSAREEAYCAYFRQIAMTSVPPYSFEDLSNDEQDRLETLPEDKRSDEERKTLSNAHQHAISQFVIDSYQYVKLVDNNYEKPLPQTLKNAEIFARIQSTKRRNKQDVLPLRLVDINPAVADIAKSDTVDAATLLPLLKESPQGLATALLSYVGHELALTDYHILATDYSNLTQMSSNEMMQTLARGVIAENIAKIIRGVSSTLKASDTLSPEDFSKSIDGLLRALSPGQDCNELAKSAGKRVDKAHIAQIGSMPTLSSAVLAEFMKA